MQCWKYLQQTWLLLFPFFTHLHFVIQSNLIGRVLHWHFLFLIVHFFPTHLLDCSQHLCLLVFFPTVTQLQPWSSAFVTIFPVHLHFFLKSKHFSPKHLTVQWQHFLCSPPPFGCQKQFDFLNVLTNLLDHLHVLFVLWQIDLFSLFFYRL